jgi:hypothetical protein
MVIEVCILKHHGQDLGNDKRPAARCGSDVIYATLRAPMKRAPAETSAPKFGYYPASGLRRLQKPTS